MYSNVREWVLWGILGLWAAIVGMGIIVRANAREVEGEVDPVVMLEAKVIALTERVEKLEKCGCLDSGIIIMDETGIKNDLPKADFDFREAAPEEPAVVAE